MKLDALRVVPMLAALLLAGCGGPDCEDVCKDIKCAEETEAECKTGCEKSENLAEKAGCDDQFDKYLSCADDAGSAVCGDKPTKCGSELSSLVSSITKYCTSNPNASECKALAE